MPFHEIFALNQTWSVLDDGDLQWCLARKSHSKGPNGSSERDSEPPRTSATQMSFCTLRTTLIRDVRARCGEVTEEGQAALDALPEKHPQPYVQKVMAKRRAKRAS